MPSIIYEIFLNQTYVHCLSILDCRPNNKFKPCLSFNVISQPFSPIKYHKLGLAINFPTTYTYLAYLIVIFFY